jgi:hypothetical protein
MNQALAGGCKAAIAENEHVSIDLGGEILASVRKICRNPHAP